MNWSLCFRTFLVDNTATRLGLLPLLFLLFLFLLLLFFFLLTPLLLLQPPFPKFDSF